MPRPSPRRCCLIAVTAVLLVAVCAVKLVDKYPSSLQQKHEAIRKQSKENYKDVPVSSFELHTDRTIPSVTVITAFFDLGTFRKGKKAYHNSSLYVEWAQPYKFLRNPFVFYTDSGDMAATFRKMRVGYENITKIIMIQRKDVQSFQWIGRIKEIYSTPGYPKHYPNTVMPEYSCVQHAKYDLVDHAVKNNLFNTTYYTWIDIGYFRYINGRNKEFVITKPPGFNDSLVAMNKVYQVSLDVAPEKIFKNNLVWIGGGMFFGNRDVLPLFIEDYRKAVEHYLSMKLSNTDQQVIYASHTRNETLVLKQRVAIQIYLTNVSGDSWFFLGFSCYKELP